MSDPADLDAIERYLSDAPEPHRSTLVAVRATLRSILPDADEAMKYGMPTFVVNAKSVASYAAFKEHCSFFPHSGNVLGLAGDAIAGYEVSKGGLRFAPDQPLPKSLVKRLVRIRLDEIAAAITAKRR